MSSWKGQLLLAVGLVLVTCPMPAMAEPGISRLDSLVGQPADIAPSAYKYRADRKGEDAPECCLGLMQYANLPFDKPLDPDCPALKKVLYTLLWEEVRQVRRVVLVWNSASQRRPKPAEVVLTYFDAEAKGSIPTWWNKAVLCKAEKPEVSADGLTYTYAIPVDTFGLVVAVAGGQDTSTYDVPVVQAFGTDRWKKMDLEIEWGFDEATAGPDYSGRIEAYDGIADRLRPLTGDAGTSLTGANQWQSTPAGQRRRGVSLSLLYIGTSKGGPSRLSANANGTAPFRTVWPYNAGQDDVARTIITAWTKAGNFSFLASDLERGPILAPEYGFFVRPLQPAAPTAKEFKRQLAARNLATVRQRVRQHAEQTWEGAVAAMFPGKTLPPIPKPAFEPPMKVEVPCKELVAQWNLGAWHLARHAVKSDDGKLHFNDHPYGILASETHLVLRSLDLMGMHKEAADGLDQWLTLPTDIGIVPGKGGHHEWAKPDRPSGLFSDGRGCLTHAEGPPGAGGHMDGIHSMGPGAIMLPLTEHFSLTGDRQWLTAHAPRMKADVDWILRQRRLLRSIIPGGARLWCRGLQPAQQVTPDSGGQLMQFYETEAYYWLAVQRFAEILAGIDPAEGMRLAVEAQAYRQDLIDAVERSITLSPVVLVRDGTYRSVLPFACYVRGLASGAWSWRRPGSGAHVGGLYWDTVQSGESLVSPAALFSPDDRRIQGMLDVLEDRLLLENPKLAERTPGFDPQKHWFSHAAWQYQPGLERHANIHLAADDPPNFLRSWLNQYAVLIQPEQDYVFNEHTTRGPPDKIFEEAAFLERFRNMLVMEENDTLWLARATPRAWLEQGKKVAVKDAPTHFGAVAYEIVSDSDHGKIGATVALPSRQPPQAVLLRFRHPQALPLRDVTVNGSRWTDFDPAKELVRLHGLTGTVKVEATY